MEIKNSNSRFTVWPERTDQQTDTHTRKIHIQTTDRGKQTYTQTATHRPVEGNKEKKEIASVSWLHDLSLELRPNKGRPLVKHLTPINRANYFSQSFQAMDDQTTKLCTPLTLLHDLGGTRTAPSSLYYGKRHSIPQWYSFSDSYDPHSNNVI